MIAYQIYWCVCVCGWERICDVTCEIWVVLRQQESVVRLAPACWKRCCWVCDVDTGQVDLGRVAAWKVDLGTRLSTTAIEASVSLFKYLLIMELCFDAILYSKLGNGNSDAGHIKCSAGPHLARGPQVPHPCRASNSNSVWMFASVCLLVICYAWVSCHSGSWRLSSHTEMKSTSKLV